MYLDDFLKNLTLNNDYYRAIDHLSEDRYLKLELSLKDNQSFSDYSKECNWFTILSKINVEHYKNKVKTFSPARKYGNRLYVWRMNPMDYYQTAEYSVPIEIGSEFFLFYNEYGKPVRAFLEDRILENIGYNSFKFSEKLTEYKSELTDQDIDNAKNGYFQYLEIFDSKPYSVKELQDFNFIFYGNSPIIEKNEILFWAKKNGFNNFSKKIIPNKKNVLVCLSEFPYTKKALLKSKIPIGLKNNTARISYKDFINIAYNIAYKENFVFSWELLKKERQTFLKEHLDFFNNNSMKIPLEKRLKKQVIEELEIQFKELDLF
jgi:hypothetical protein